MTIKQIRESMGLNGSRFAALIGASPGQLHDWENGRQRLTLERAAQIERATGAYGLIAAVVAERTKAA